MAAPGYGGPEPIYWSDEYEWCIVCLLEVKQGTVSRLSHIPCQQTVVNTAGSGDYSNVDISGTNNSYSVTTGEKIGQHSSLVPAGGWSRADPSDSVPLTGVPQTEFSSSLQPAGMATVSSQSSGFHSTQNIPLSGLQTPTPPFDGYPDGSTQLQSLVQNHTNTSAASSVCC